MADGFRIAEEVIDDVLEFYQRNGVELSYRPILKYIEQPHPTIPIAIAQVKAEIKSQQAFSSYFNASFQKALWRNAYNITLSEEALAESMDLQDKLIARFSKANKNIEEITLSHFSSSNADILIYPLINHEKYDEEVISYVMAHEIWHLIEMERGVYENSILISEGTATHAANLVLDYDSNIPIENCSNLFDLMYNGAAGVVKKHIERGVNPYLAMLDTGKREVIQRDFLERLQKNIVKAASGTFETLDMRPMFKAMIDAVPEYQKLRGNLNRDSIINLYEELNAPNMARDLRRQDLTQLIFWYEKLGVFS